MRHIILVLSVVLSLWQVTGFAAIERHMIPRASTSQFVNDGIFQGGTEAKANLETIRVADHPKQNMERWVLDFSEVKTRKLGDVAPKFQIQYLKEDRITLANGQEQIRRPAKFLIILRSLNKNFLTNEKAKQLAKKSQFVSDVVLHPPIEEGDMAIELVLNENVRFEAHQPIEREGRLVLDMKPTDDEG